MPAGYGHNILLCGLTLKVVYCGFKYGGHPGPSLIHPLRAQPLLRPHIQARPAVFHPGAPDVSNA
ncbi:hypothetical protein GCM10009825_15750 [Arthrobacter humicola]|uniref:Uncharacterized protein n=1 Tax=Arthrobacter humicola TaxID=409291 RepID=A0ABN2YXV2_9MICC